MIPSPQMPGWTHVDTEGVLPCGKDMPAEASLMSPAIRFRSGMRHFCPWVYPSSLRRVRATDVLIAFLVQGARRVPDESPRAGSSSTSDGERSDCASEPHSDTVIDALRGACLRDSGQPGELGEEESVGA